MKHLIRIIDEVLAAAFYLVAIPFMAVSFVLTYIANILQEDAQTRY